MTLQKSAFKWLHEAANWQYCQYRDNREGRTILVQRGRCCTCISATANTFGTMQPL
jgi:hypothetical protein